MAMCILSNRMVGPAIADSDDKPREVGLIPVSLPAVGMRKRRNALEVSPKPDGCADSCCADWRLWMLYIACRGPRGCNASAMYECSWSWQARRAATGVGPRNRTGS